MRSEVDLEKALLDKFISSFIPFPMFPILIDVLYGIESRSVSIIFADILLLIASSCFRCS